MKYLGLAIVLLAGVWASGAEQKVVDSVFKKMPSLEGEWEGTDADGHGVHSSFEPVISRTTLMETLSPSGMDEMLSLYSIDGDGHPEKYPVFALGTPWNTDRNDERGSLWMKRLSDARSLLQQHRLSNYRVAASRELGF